ncbi:mechanosensitive ion channel family protein [Agaribacter flavus]|uniref:Mechanosensitive ion channel family protein n=1 Tax=Agaribacter flavus TaxID=1902781 RepID=A0ABV7FS82_9ALTE
MQINLPDNVILPADLQMLTLGLFELVQQHKIVSSVLLLLFIAALRKAFVFALKQKSQKKGEDRRHQINNVNLLTTSIAIVLALVIWASEIQHFAISIAAFTVAIVLATRDFIQCLMGFFYYVTAKPFRVGEWVQFDGSTIGEVVRVGWTNTVLLEIHGDELEYTGKHLHVPNSKLVTHTTKNFNFLKRYKLHSFALTLEANIPIHAYLEHFTRIAETACDDFSDVALRYKGFIERQLDTEFISVEPTITLETNQFAKQVVSITVFCPTNEVATIQRAITTRILSLVHQIDPDKNAKGWGVNEQTFGV